jgi:hypothetical protein
MFYVGRDNLRMAGFKIFIGVVRRSKVNPGEHKHRLCISLHASFKFGIVLTVYTYPAWRDVRSVVEEYERTMDWNL